MTQEELKKILDDHKLWLENKGGLRANLIWANLERAIFQQRESSPGSIADSSLDGESA